jgi:hypothetical protein
VRGEKPPIVGQISARVERFARVIAIVVTLGRSHHLAAYVYAVRLLAFALIIAAVVDKNRRA